MARPILMPQVGQDLTEGKLTALNVAVGDKVRKGDIVAEVESEKAVFEVEAFETGTVLEIRYKVGDMAVVLEPLIMVGEEGEVLESAAQVEAIAGEVEAIAATAGAIEDAPPEVAARIVAQADSLHTGKAGSSPLARRLAAIAGIDIVAVSGSGPRGAVVKRDIEAFQRSRASVSTVVSGRFGAAKPASGGLTLRSLQPGTGDPVVLLHGFGAELSAWRSFIVHLNLANPVLAIDLPGHGSAAGEGADSFESVVASVQAAFSAEKIDRLHLVGHSLGAAVATAIAGSGASDIRSLTLISPAGLGPKINGDFISGFLSSHSEAALKAWLELLVHNPASLPGVLVRATLASREGTAMVENQSRVAAGIFAGDTQLFSIRDDLHRFAGPARVIVGRDDRIIPAGYAEAVPAHVALHRLAGIGHLPQLEAAALVGRLVSETVRSAG